MSGASARRIALCTGAALCAFAANSLLCRAALAPRAIDAATFTSVRLGSGALALALIVRLTGPRGSATHTTGSERKLHGSWLAASALFAYAITFSFAYLRIPTGVGALIAFGAVQVTMLTGALFRGERLRALQWLGLALALGGLAWLTLPGASAPDPIGAFLMALAGIAWGVYSLLGRGSTDPLASTARNFFLTLPLTIAASALAYASWHTSPRGLVLAIVSGAITSGVGYTIWYTALRGISASTAAVAQLSVPILAGAGGVVFLGETPNARLVTAALFVLGGIALALPRVKR
jgi:drug/metabolite transporter (DMT)-like permease